MTVGPILANLLGPGAINHRIVGDNLVIDRVVNGAVVEVGKVVGNVRGIQGLTGGLNAEQQTIFDAQVTKVNQLDTQFSARAAGVVGAVIVAQPVAPTETTRNGVPVVWIDTSEGKTVITPTAPTFTITSYTIPTQSGVFYRVNGTTQAAGTYTVSDARTVTIRAVAGSAFVLYGTSEWSYTWLGSTPAPSDAYKNAVLASGPSVYLPLDDVAGTTAPRNLGADAVTVAVSGGVQLGVAGIGDGVRAAKITASTSGRVTITGISKPARTVATVEAIVTVPSVTSGQGRVFGSTAAGLSVGLFNARPIANGGGTVLADGSVVGQRVHMMAIKNGGNLSLFANGQQVGAPVVNSTNVSINELGIGYNGTNSGIDVTIAGAAYYDKALTPADALAHAQAAGLA
ncbi:hypothetical protein [Pseudoclavibacter sp. VKM Ac-2888]|uniref:hypothetical protein n=1 Tax=Pseudoclavibacter sp. VKM Ac-2888 TaxID=2783830 RepID=UPI001889DF48|nr:hypothetical protein [Pseudoclavibacter sp. VKM Ac-2888]MBF4549662.1 hypothetical protein [Pseudoclavibacter sp. VKM Ac-2888]